MLEVQRMLHRDGVARVLELEINGRILKTPLLMFICNEHIKPFENADLFLVDKKFDTSSLHKPFLLYDYDEKTDIPYSLLNFPPFFEFKDDKIKVKNNIAVCSKNVIESEKLKQFVDTHNDITMFVLQDAYELLKNHIKSFVKTVIALRTMIGAQKLIYAPGICKPSDIAILVYLGIDIFDSAQLALAATHNKMLFADHNFEFIHTDKICKCTACIKNNAEDTNTTDAFNNILLHNMYAASAELKLVHTAISNSRLRELVEVRTFRNTSTVILRELDLRFYDILEKNYPITGISFYASDKTLYRPDVVRFRKRVIERYYKPMHKKILLLLPCSAKKPYSSSKSHRLFKSAIPKQIKDIVHEVIITSPLGIVPRELELVYPAQNYDVTVTGDWSKDEIHIVNSMLKEFIMRNTYEKIVVHLPPELWFVLDVLPEYTCTVNANCKITDRTALTNLYDTLCALSDKLQLEKAHHLLEIAKCIASYQFGSASEKLFIDSIVTGKYPDIRIYAQNILIATLSSKKGMFRLTLEGGRIIASTNDYCVEIDDFYPKGDTIFAAGVAGADDKIRIGDEVVVKHGDDVRGVGIAKMHGYEMAVSKKGVAVKLRETSNKP